MCSLWSGSVVCSFLLEFGFVHLRRLFVVKQLFFFKCSNAEKYYHNDKVFGVNTLR